MTFILKKEKKTIKAPQKLIFLRSFRRLIDLSLGMWVKQYIFLILFSKKLMDGHKK